MEEERANDEIARKILALRTKAGLTQTQLGKLVGTIASVICRLEDADYEGHSLAMLRRIALRSLPAGPSLLASAEMNARPKHGRSARRLWRSAFSHRWA